jgi:hypothetical protein
MNISNAIKLCIFNQAEVTRTAPTSAIPATLCAMLTAPINHYFKLKQITHMKIILNPIKQI